MKSLIAFWKQDVINKLIVIVASALLLGGAVVVFLVIKMPQGRSLGNAFAEVFPSATPTFDLNSLLTNSALTTGPKSPTPISTFFLPTFTPSPAFSVPTQAQTPTPIVVETPTFAVSPTVAATLAATRAPLGVINSDCIPNNETRKGRVVEVLDGNTTRILIEQGLIYVVRYIGIAAPANKTYAEAAKQKNSELVYGREVTLIEDGAPKDERGRLLRYVLTGEVFLNLEMIKQGLGSAQAAPDFSCAAIFAEAQETTRTLMLGMWSLPTPSK